MTRTFTSQKLVDFCIITLFLAALLTPLTLWIVQKDVSFSEVEKRQLQPFPILDGLQSITGFTHSFDSYFQDHFGLREWLIHRYQREASKRFGISGIADVVEGSDDWLYLSSSGILTDLKGKLQFPATEKKLFWSHLIEMEKWLKEQGTSYIFLVSPNKQTIYPEYLPDFYQSPRKPGRLDKLITAKPVHGGESLLDVRSNLQRGKAQRRLYFKSDTHWNTQGAHLAYQAIMERTQLSYPEVRTREKFHFKQLWENMSDGDLAVMIGKKGSVREQNQVLDSTGFTAVPKKLSKALTDILTSQQLQTFHTENKNAQLRVLVLHDSFFHALKPYISESFGEVLYVTRYRNGATMQFLNHSTLKKLVALYKPDIVIEELVERNLQHFLPQPPAPQTNTK